ERPGPVTGQVTHVLYTTFARLANGVSPEAARDAVQAIVVSRAVSEPDRRDHVASVRDLSESYTTLNSQALIFFFGASLLVLVLAVTNTAGLLLSRALRRAPEFALRGALGGGGAALASQLLVEAALVTLPACAIGLWLAYEAVALVGGVLPDRF